MCWLKFCSMHTIREICRNIIGERIIYVCCSLAFISPRNGMYVTNISTRWDGLINYGVWYMIHGWKNVWSLTNDWIRMSSMKVYVFFLFSHFTIPSHKIAMFYLSTVNAIIACTAQPGPREWGRSRNGKGQQLDFLSTLSATTFFHWKQISDHWWSAPIITKRTANCAFEGSISFSPSIPVGKIENTAIYYRHLYTYWLCGCNRMEVQALLKDLSGLEQSENSKLMLEYLSLVIQC